MPRDTERTNRIVAALREANLDALVCALPINVLLLTGYWPVVGTSVAIVTRESQVIVIAPEDEHEMASVSGADRVKAFSPGSLKGLSTVIDSIRGCLRAEIENLRLTRVRIGYEYSEISQPVTYAAMHLYGGGLLELLRDVCTSGKFIAADDLLTRSRSVKTPQEIARITTACDVAARAFTVGANQLRAGLNESEAANLFRAPLSETSPDSHRADGFTFCMSGPNAAEAYASYQLSRARRIVDGDVVLLHCNSYVDGYWTDITRTFGIGELSEQKLTMYEAMFSAHEAAMETVRVGVRCSDIDRAARETLKARGFEREFKHGLGHSVGFEAIDHNAPPRLHPQSIDVLQTGMVFNVEPAIYIEGQCGMRHCDMLALTETGPELLTQFQRDTDTLIRADV